jgi:hypothetical protein
VLAQAPKSTAPQKAAFRRMKQSEGFYETTVFVHESARDEIDRSIAEGRFKTRREAMEHAIHSLFRAEERAKKPR